MKKIFEDDLRLSDFKDFVGNARAKNKYSLLIIILAIIGFVSAIAAVAYAITKLCRTSDEFDFDDFDYDDENCDENGCYFTDEEDFEK